jgi:SAM-dependent methyltransferase
MLDPSFFLFEKGDWAGFRCGISGHKYHEADVIGGASLTPKSFKYLSDTKALEYKCTPVKEPNCCCQNMSETREGNDCGVFITHQFYSAFEDRFRGTREEIANRQSIYLPILEKSETLKSEAPILDIGCGRGEWLTLLGQRGYRARGVDLNEQFVLECQKRGLDVVCGEASQYLCNQPAESFSAVTSFHLVEHLPFAQLVGFVAEIFRVLRPGGVMILETPNPENLTVGACSFYLDPSHLTPIPPGLLQFISEKAGFSSPSVARVNAEALGVPLPYLPSEAPFSLQLNAVIHLLNQSFYRSPDYSVIAQKGGGTASIIGSKELNHLCEPAPMDNMHFRQLEAEAKAQRAELRTLEAEAKAKQAQVNAQEAEAKAKQAQVNAQQAEAKAQQAEAKAQQAEAKAQQAELKGQQMESELRTLVGSKSWRVTAPLRTFNRFIKTLFRMI